MSEVAAGDGYNVSSIDQLGEGPGFRKIRKPLGVTAFGVNAIVLPEGFDTGWHYHDQQEELYFVHKGTLEFEFGDGSKHRVEPGGLVWADAPTARTMRNVGEGDAVFVIVGGKDGYVGRDGRVPEGKESPRSRAGS